MRAQLRGGFLGASRVNREAPNLNDLFSRSRLPARLSREGRVQLLGQLAKALLSDKRPDRDAALFLAGALLAWLEHGGDLERDYLRVSATAGSHRTPAAIWEALQRSSRGGPGSKPERMLQAPINKGAKAS